MAGIKIWNKVPDKSRLVVRVEGGTGTVRGLYTVSDGTTEEWSDAELRAGKVKTLRTPKRYALTLELRFAADSTMTVMAHIEKPGGGHHGSDFEEPVTGTPGALKIVAIGVVTLQS